MAKAVIGLVVMFHTPLNHHPARLAMEDLEAVLFGWRGVSRPLSIAQSLAFISSFVAVAMVVRFGFLVLIIALKGPAPQMLGGGMLVLGSGLGY